MDDQQHGEVDGTEEDWLDAYPPDDEEDEPGMNVPMPRAQRVRQQAMQASGIKAKSAKRLAKKSNRILVQEKRRKALELRKAGATYQQIADAVGYSNASAARKAVLKGFGEVIQEPVAELKVMQVERLNHMLMVLWPKVQTGDTGAIHTALAVMNKIDMLEGTEAAKQVKVTNDSAILVVDGSKDDYIAALRKMTGVGADGRNVTAEQENIPELGAGPSQVPTQSQKYPPGMGEGAVMVEDIVDAEVVDEDGAKMSDCPSPLGTVCKDPSCPLHYPGNQTEEAPAVPTKKKFSFGVDPTVRREKR